MSAAICSCGLKGVHFICKSCGMHAGTKSSPCLGCRFFRFDSTEQRDRQELDTVLSESREVLVDSLPKKEPVDPNTVPPPGGYGYGMQPTTRRDRRRARA